MGKVAVNIALIREAPIAKTLRILTNITKLYV